MGDKKKSLALCSGTILWWVCTGPECLSEGFSWTVFSWPVSFCGSVLGLFFFFFLAENFEAKVLKRLTGFERFRGRAG